MTLKEFGRKLRKVINRPDVFEILADGDWGAGGCWILAEALYRLLHPHAELWAITSEDNPVEHVLVKVDDVFIDYLGAQSLRQLSRNMRRDFDPNRKYRLVPFTGKLRDLATEAGDVPCHPQDVKRLTSKLHEAFPSLVS